MYENDSISGSLQKMIPFLTWYSHIAGKIGKKSMGKQ